MSNNTSQPKKKKLKMLRAGPYKFKDKEGRNTLMINFETVYGFNPDTIIIEKVKGENNTFFISAVKPSNGEEKPPGEGPKIFLPGGG